MANWVAVVDHDSASRKTIGQILGRENIDVSELRSGAALRDFLQSNRPNLIMLDVTLPDMSGFEAMDLIRAMEGGHEEVPVIFLVTEADQDKESLALQMGASDVIRKPFDAAALVSRVRNALRMQEKMRQYEQDVMTDSMTGFLNKSTSEARMEELCSRETGILCVLDLDAFKMVNDFYGHDMGDEALVLFSRILRRRMRSNDVCGRIGGDEFILFMRNMRSEEELRGFVERINEEYLSEVEKVIGNQLNIHLGVSVGAVAVPEMGRDYPTLFRFADRALYTVKQNGKHGCSLYGEQNGTSHGLCREMNLETTTAILEERAITPSAMWMGEEAFIGIYRYMVRYMERYHGIAFRVLFTVGITDETCSPSERAEIILQFRSRVQHSLRNSDVMMEVGENKLFLLLPAAKDYDVEKVIARLLENWHQSPLSEKAVITYETGHVHLHEHPEYHHDPEEE